METTVYIFNLSEDVWPFIQAMAGDEARKAEINENAALGDRDLFSVAAEDNVLFITPQKVSPEFFSYTQSLLGNKNISLISPDHHTGQICEDILSDPLVMQAIVRAANSSKRLSVTAYSTSMQFLHLVDVLKSQGFIVATPESPEREDAWTVNFYGSKSGIRQLAQQSRVHEPDFIMADGLICANIEDSAKIASKMYAKGNGVVLKTNKGHSGAGILIFRQGDLPPDYAEREKAILKILSQNPYWEKYPIIIEDFVPTAATVGGGCPDVEYKILKNGRIELLYYCGMRVSKDGVFRGVEISNEVVSDRLAAQMIDTGFYIGERYAQAGYRGYFDVDFVAGKNGTLYVTESNVRRTGGTHVYNTAYHLFGRDFMYLTHILSNNNYPLAPGRKYAFSEMQQLLKPILFNKKTKEGLVIVSENLLVNRQTLAYIIFGNTEKRALETEETMVKLLKL